MPNANTAAKPPARTVLVVTLTAARCSVHYCADPNHRIEAYFADVAVTRKGADSFIVKDSNETILGCVSQGADSTWDFQVVRPARKVPDDTSHLSDAQHRAILADSAHDVATLALAIEEDMIRTAEQSPATERVLLCSVLRGSAKTRRACLANVGMVVL